MSLVNVAYAAVLTWANPRQTRLEDQVFVPMYGEHPIELGLNVSDTWLDALSAIEQYRRMFAAAFGVNRVRSTRENLVKAIASFERAIVSARSPYDRYHFQRDDSAISDAAKRGEVLFHSRPLSCFTCHGGIHFSGAMGAGRGSMAIEFHNTGLYNLAGARSYPAGNLGLYEVKRAKSTDVGKFKAPTLRNIAVTAPYMHDGSVATLEDAIDHYAAGGRTIADGPYQGVGRDNPNKSPADSRLYPDGGAARRSRGLPPLAHGRGAPARPAIRQSVDRRAQAVAQPGKPMSPRIRRSLDWLFALWLLIGDAAGSWRLRDLPRSLRLPISTSRSPRSRSSSSKRRARAWNWYSAHPVP